MKLFNYYKYAHVVLLEYIADSALAELVFHAVTRFNFHSDLLAAEYKTTALNHEGDGVPIIEHQLLPKAVEGRIGEEGQR